MDIHDQAALSASLPRWIYPKNVRGRGCLYKFRQGAAGLFVSVTATTMGTSLEWGAWGVRDVRRYGQPTLDFETGYTRSCAQHAGGAGGNRRRIARRLGQGTAISRSAPSGAEVKIKRQVQADGTRRTANNVMDMRLGAFDTF